MCCRVRARIEVLRCFKCLGFGHRKKDCEGPDRSDCCWKCGITGHRAAGCAGSQTCFLCRGSEDREAAHVARSGKCAAFKAARTEARTLRTRE